MSDAITTNINASVQKTNEWISDVGRELGATGNGDRQVAYHALRCVLHSLRDRLPTEEAVHLAAQMPSLLRGIYYEGWSPAHKPEKMDVAQFLEDITSAWGAPDDRDPKECARAVFAVLTKRIGSGEIADVRGCLPKEIESLWQ